MFSKILNFADRIESLLWKAKAQENLIQSADKLQQPDALNQSMKVADEKVAEKN